MMRQWGGIVDVCPDASPIISKTEVKGFYINGGWGTGGWKATPGSGHVFADLIAKDEPNKIAAPFTLERFASRRARRRARRRGRGALEGMMGEVSATRAEEQVPPHRQRGEGDRRRRWRGLTPIVAAASAPSTMLRMDPPPPIDGGGTAGWLPGAPMFLIRCPYCGERDISDFSYGGEAHIARPTSPETMSDAEWAGYVFLRTNPKGVFAERWNHQAGCRRWFNALRNTATDEILAVYKIGEPRPARRIASLPATPSGEAPIGSGNDAVKVMAPGEGENPQS